MLDYDRNSRQSDIRYLIFIVPSSDRLIMKYLFLAVLTFFSIGTFAQQPQGLSPTEFQKLRSDYVKMTKSEDYVSMRAKSKELAAKLNQAKDWESFKSDDTWNKWIIENISKTKFSSIEEANHLRNQMFELTRKNQIDYRDMWQRFRQASQQQRIELLAAEYKGEFE